MRTRQCLRLALLCASLTAVGASGQQTNQTSSSSPAGLGQAALANQVYGHQVLSSDNQKIGNLNNLVVDLESGRILYGVIGTKQGRVAVPPEIFTSTTPSANELRVNATQQKVDGAPKFDPVDKQSQWGSAEFISQVYSYFGQNAWWQGSTPANVGSFHNVHKSSQVMGMKVENVNNQTIGKIKNLAVDLPNGRVVAAIFAPDSSLNLGNNEYPLPPQALTLSSDQKNLVSNLDAAKLSSAPHFTGNNWPNFSDPSFVGQMYEYYGKQPWFNTGNGVQPTGR